MVWDVREDVWCERVPFLLLGSPVSGCVRSPATYIVTNLSDCVPRKTFDEGTWGDPCFFAAPPTSPSLERHLLRSIAQDVRFVRLT